MNPTAAINPLTAAYQGIAGMGGVNPQQLQLAQILAARAAISQLFGVSPWASGLHNPLTAGVLQNPLLQGGLENQLLTQILAQSQFGAQPHFGNPQIGQGVPQFGQGGQPFGQFGSPYGQIGSQYGQNLQTLAPQSWVGQQGLAGIPGQGQVHPLLAQLVARSFPGAGINPWTGF
jgi:hypothetical protein